MKIVYERKTATLRQTPGNYLLAFRDNNAGRWIADPDIAADKAICLLVFEALLTYRARYASGPDLIDIIEARRADSSERTEGLTEEQVMQFGSDVAYLLEAHKDREHPDRWITDIGSKTNLGLGYTVLRLLQEVRD